MSRYCCAHLPNEPNALFQGREQVGIGDVGDLNSKGEGEKFIHFRQREIWPPNECAAAGEEEIFTGSEWVEMRKAEGIPSAPLPHFRYPPLPLLPASSPQSREIYGQEKINLAESSSPASSSFRYRFLARRTEEEGRGGDLVAALWKFPLPLQQGHKLWLGEARRRRRAKRGPGSKGIPLR